MKKSAPQKRARLLQPRCARSHSSVAPPPASRARKRSSVRLLRLRLRPLERGAPFPFTSGVEDATRPSGRAGCRPGNAGEAWWKIRGHVLPAPLCQEHPWSADTSAEFATFSPGPMVVPSVCEPEASGSSFGSA
ncbi:hypothetical protein AKJ08_1804 [Vulgatibacter incomptus]|uniref:Uncharacterized protein n=1 Tax=Vulgatibacter incomptus TaxID=1391653 RepID=A0A0K1PD39_9BACT|nr:hypothetical protein AKJ08_1804 [Vulgatibacter incomptus]